MNETIKLPRGFASRGERGMRWLLMFNTLTKKKSVSVLCRCARLLTVKPKPDGTVNFRHRCGFAALLRLEDYDPKKC